MYPMRCMHGLHITLGSKHIIHIVVARRLLPNMRGWPKRSALVLVEDMALGCLSQHKKDQDNFKALCKLRGAVAKLPAQTNCTLQEPARLTSSSIELRLVRQHLALLIWWAVGLCQPGAQAMQNRSSFKSGPNLQLSRILEKESYQRTLCMGQYMIGGQGFTTSLTCTAT